ncbi:M28 family metallopeptidase [Cecembia sp.]|uniref:M28 family metallopeptidase n=1 Tax=Cecembia sp. TaxID=1898110 RepID=UPI0025BA8DA7|nr:M28 family metallopeptidase [Cecembia sp.]
MRQSNIGKTPPFLLILAMLFGCAEKGNLDYNFKTEDFEPHVIALSSDDFMGRMPFTEGEILTLDYLEAQFIELGLQPGNGDSFFQEVPMMSIISQPEEIMRIKKPGGEITLEGFRDYVLWTQRVDSEVKFEDAEIVFAGYGIVAPEYGWNDYENLDVEGKIVMVMVNDPGFGREETDLFKGNAMTYYGRWTYKFEEAARQGALGTLIIHDTEPAGYGFNVIQNGWNSAKLYLDSRGSEMYRPVFEGWVTLPVAKKLFDMAEMDAEEMLGNARSSAFQPVSLGLKASSSINVTVNYAQSKNAIALIEGKSKPDEYLIYTAHWDHLGIGKPDETGDSIYNGALDNASGVAALLALGKAFQSNPPERSIVLLMVTAEEQGLWGSAYYAKNPVFPKEKTLANINIDGINHIGKMRDVSVIGVGQSDLEDLLEDELQKLGRYSAPEPTPSAGYYYRSDHFNFAKIGIPALYFGTGIDHVEKGKEYGLERQLDFTMNHYHKPSDKFIPGEWDLDAALDEIKLYHNIGQRLANSRIWPQWKEGSEFKSVREAYMKR